MDDRTRQRQPLLSTLVEHMENRYVHLRDLLEHAAAAVGGGTAPSTAAPTSVCGAAMMNDASGSQDRRT